MRKTATLLATAILLGTPAAAQVYSTTDVPAAPPAYSGFDPARAQRNYELLLHGQKSLEQLSPQEFAEVQALDSAVRARNHAYKADKRSPRQKCLDDEIKHAGGSPSRLELRVIDLKCSQR